MFKGWASDEQQRDIWGGRMKKTKAVLLGVILWSLLLISGCNFIRIEEEPRKPLEYSIVKKWRDTGRTGCPDTGEKEEWISADLSMWKRLVSCKRIRGANERRLQYFRGRTGVDFPGCFFRTMLLGPSDEKITISPPSYPYIVVKTEYRKEPVILKLYWKKAKNDAI